MYNTFYSYWRWRRWSTYLPNHQDIFLANDNDRCFSVFPNLTGAKIFFFWFQVNISECMCHRVLFACPSISFNCMSTAFIARSINVRIFCEIIIRLSSICMVNCFMYGICWWKPGAREKSTCRVSNLFILCCYLLAYNFANRINHLNVHISVIERKCQTLRTTERRYFRILSLPR